ncbi:unnamed protein product [Acanthosepion pharaonis]|uniref:Uncharacterized protein n=1 Tax=Acanthosepion pharaonis TaxID=158019 RepID=A0A812DFA5_ACAPH|nr:unnamed protein product [Sepia pharaonis]
MRPISSFLSNGRGSLTVIIPKPLPPATTRVDSFLPQAHTDDDNQILSLLCSSPTLSLCLLILSLIPSNIIHYLMTLLFPHPLPVSSQSLPYPFQYNSDDPLSHDTALPSPFACIFSFSPLSLPNNSDDPLSHYTALPSPFACIFSFSPLSLSNTTQMIRYRMTLPFPHHNPLSHDCSSLTVCLYLPILSLILSNTTKMIRYLMTLFFPHPLPVSSHSLPYPFQYNSDDPLSHDCSSLTLCLYLLILSLIPFNTT